MPIFIYFIMAIAAFGITALILHFLIPVLASKKMGQKILDIGPRWHKNKEGTPTMGGLAFLATALICGIASTVILIIYNGVSSTLPFIFTLVMAILSGVVGIVDDWAKLRKAQNEGLKSWQKFLLQMLVSALYLVSMRIWGGLTTELYIPFFNVTIELGIFYYIIAMLLLCGIMNSVNLTDGIDGLASTITLVVCIFFTIAALIHGQDVNQSVASISTIGIGCTIGFLFYNFYPARVFMGDTGSLFLGGLVVGSAFLLGNPLIIVVAGLVYIIETASVMLQVSYFKLTHGKRLFKMSPIHHHFEKCGWGEIKIVTVFGIATVLFCILGWFGIS